TSVNDDQDLLGQLLCLREGKNLEKLVHGSKAARKNHQSLCQVREPELTHEEVVKLEIQGWRDIRIRRLLKRQINVQPDGFALGLIRAAVRSFHDAGAASRRHHKAMALGRD